jgi:hypothetical protein
MGAGSRLVRHESDPFELFCRDYRLALTSLVIFEFYQAAQRASNSSGGLMGSLIVAANPNLCR